MSAELSNVYVDVEGHTRYIDWETKWNFLTMRCHVLPDCVGIPNIDHIWPLKQRIVRDLYLKIEPLGVLDELWVFGSSTQVRCHMHSDLDLAYRVKPGVVENVHRLFEDCDPNGYDLIDLNRIDQNSVLWKEIHRGARII